MADKQSALSVAVRNRRSPAAEFPTRDRRAVWAFALVALFLLFARRYAQSLDPHVWDEEGRIISALVNHGIASIVDPLNGYLLVLPKLLSCLAMIVPFAEYPRVVTMLTWTGMIFMLVAIQLDRFGLIGLALPVSN